MKKIILLLITLTTFTNVSYASFPITESPTEQLSESNTEASVSANSLASSMGGLHWAWWVVIIIFALLLSYILFAVFYFLSTFP